jgi:hypothetical protein
MGVPGSRSAALLRGRQKEGGPHSPGESLAARRTGYPECGIHLPAPGHSMVTVNPQGRRFWNQETLGSAL